MAYEKQNFIPGQKLKASQLNHIEDGIVNAVSVTEQTLSEEQKAKARANIGITGTGANGEDGRDGVDGYTPVKGVDYFDGVDGKDGTDGKDGYTPVKGKDYYTDSEKTQMVADVTAGLAKITLVGTDEDDVQHTFTLYGVAN